MALQRISDLIAVENVNQDTNDSFFELTRQNPDGSFKSYKISSKHLLEQMYRRMVQSRQIKRISEFAGLHVGQIVHSVFEIQNDRLVKADGKFYSGSTAVQLTGYAYNRHVSGFVEWLSENADEQSYVAVPYTSFNSYAQNRAYDGRWLVDFDNALIRVPNLVGRAVKSMSAFHGQVFEPQLPNVKGTIQQNIKWMGKSCLQDLRSDLVYQSAGGCFGVRFSDIERHMPTPSIIYDCGHLSIVNSVDFSKLNSLFGDGLAVDSIKLLPYVVLDGKTVNLKEV